MTKTMDEVSFLTTARAKPINVLLKLAAKQHVGGARSWKQKRKEIMRKKLPVQQLKVFKYNGCEVVESVEMFMHVAEHLYMAGGSDGEKSKISNTVAALNKIFNQVGFIAFNESLSSKRKSEAFGKLVSESSTKSFFDSFENELKSHGEKYYLGNYVCAVDVFFGFAMQFIESYVPSILEPFSSLKAYKGNVTALLPNVQDD